MSTSHSIPAYKMNNKEWWEKIDLQAGVKCYSWLPWLDNSSNLRKILWTVILKNCWG